MSESLSICIFWLLLAAAVDGDARGTLDYYLLEIVWRRLLSYLIQKIINTYKYYLHALSSFYSCTAGHQLARVLSRRISVINA
jgi:hypothetical protein